MRLLRIKSEFNGICQNNEQFDSDLFKKVQIFQILSIKILVHCSVTEFI